jgi:hypothetical protein
MADHYEGKCCGGPHDGQMLAHWSKRKTYYRPLAVQPVGGLEVAAGQVDIGSYVLNDFGQWHWHATTEGRAYDTLFGA